MACTLHANQTAVYVPGKDPSEGILSPVYYDITHWEKQREREREREREEEKREREKKQSKRKKKREKN